VGIDSLSCSREQLAMKKHTSHVPNYLNLKIGYREGNAAWALAEDEGGVGFLGLAAVLLASCSTVFIAAATLHDLLMRSTSKSQPLPTLRQLQVLLQALEYKLAPAVFHDHICKWSTLLYDGIMQGLDPTSRYHTFLRNPLALETMLQSHIPKETSGEWADILECIAQLERLGEADFVEIQLGDCSILGWLIAFIKWCVGLPSTVRIGSFTLIDQPRARILITVEEPNADPFNSARRTRKYIIYRTVENLREIAYHFPNYTIYGTVDNTALPYHYGMVSISSRLNYCLRESGLRTYL
jgi:hypothetical protein